MRYLLFFIALWGVVTAYAQHPAGHAPANDERYYCLDSNNYLRYAQFATIRDSLKKAQIEADKAGDYELASSLKLYIYVRDIKDKFVSKDTSEYRLQKLASDAAEKNNKRLEADVRQALGEFYANDYSQPSAGIEQYLLAYSIYRNLNSVEYPNKREYTYRLGLVYYMSRDYEQAIRYLHEAARVKPAATFHFSYPIANTIGLSYRNMNMYDSAVSYFQGILETATRRNDQIWVGISQGNIGICYFYQKKYAEAEPLLKKDIELSLANSNIKNAVNSMRILAAIYYDQKKYADAEKLLLSALAQCHKKFFWSDCSVAEQVYGGLYNIYKIQKKYQVASLYADSALMAKDSSISRHNAIASSIAYEKQNFIKKKLAAEKSQNQAKIDQLRKFDQQQTLYKIIIGFLAIVFMIAIVVNRYRGNLREISTNTQDAPEIVVQKMSIVIISIATCAAALVWTGLYYYYYGFCLVTLLPFSYFLLVAPSLLIYFFTKKEQLLVNVQLFCIFFITLFIEFLSGGFKAGIVIMWAFLAPVGALMYKSIRHAAVWMALFIITIISVAVLHDYLSPLYKPLPETAQFMFDCMNILGPVIVIYFSMQFFVKSVIRDGKLLQENNVVLSNTLGELKLEKQKSDDLLLNILPEEVADELKVKGSTTAKHFDNVTVLFTDFVNFTEAGEQMKPQELIDELHSCFKAFDEIIEKHNIEKIKTIGDAYLAVAGLPSSDPKHAENVVSAALEIRAYMEARLASRAAGTFHIRLGIHSGSVVAGVVGVKKFAYDIWGDTVNTAARMEQNSEPGKINISQTTYDMIKDKFKCTYRGEIDAKGKGMLKMYYVTGLS